MDPGVVQQLPALRHPQEAGALLEGLWPQLGHLQQLLPAGKGAVCLPVGHNVPGCGGIQACYLGQKTGGGGVDVHPHGVYAVLHHAAERFV